MPNDWAMKRADDIRSEMFDESVPRNRRTIGRQEEIIAKALEAVARECADILEASGASYAQMIRDRFPTR